MSATVGWLALMSGPSLAAVEVWFSPEAAIRDTTAAKARLEWRLQMAFDFLFRDTGRYLDLEREDVRTVVGCNALPDESCTPVCHVPADSTIWIVRELAEPLSDMSRAVFLSALGASALSQHAESHSTLEVFIWQELAHETGHDWMYRTGQGPDEMPLLLGQRDFWRNRLEYDSNLLTQSIVELTDKYLRFEQRRLPLEAHRLGLRGPDFSRGGFRNVH